ncbi:hypothetical protein H0H93_001396, partial [Arthromyces matolae]
AVYGPKALFLAGFATVGVGSLINGFAVNGPMLFVIRALQGVGAALTIPSAVTMIVLLFPNRTEQDRALGIFAGLGAAGHVGGLVILQWRDYIRENRMEMVFLDNGNDSFRTISRHVHILSEPSTLKE